MRAPHGAYTGPSGCLPCAAYSRQRTRTPSLGGRRSRASESQSAKVATCTDDAQPRVAHACDFACDMHLISRLYLCLFRCFYGPCKFSRVMGLCFSHSHLLPESGKLPSLSSLATLIRACFLMTACTTPNGTLSWGCSEAAKHCPCREARSANGHAAIYTRSIAAIDVVGVREDPLPHRTPHLQIQGIRVVKVEFNTRPRSSHRWSR